MEFNPNHQTAVYIWGAIYDGKKGEMRKWGLLLYKDAAYSWEEKGEVQLDGTVKGGMTEPGMKEDRSLWEGRTL